ncbi:hypothetical protein AB0L44_31185 [Nonomuraea wenchangensis]|uniref:hypothetical protein n=1 Tax=Nonomuraea wenchangensis TaxID=568860 RepID=UPI003433EBAD
MKKIMIAAGAALTVLTTGSTASAEEATAAVAPVPGEVFIDDDNIGVHRAGQAVITLAAVQLPEAGNYLLHASLDFAQDGGTPRKAGARCDFQLPNERLVWYGMQTSIVGPEEEGSLSFQTAVTTTAPGPVNLKCYSFLNGGPDVFFNHATLTAQSVPKITRF